jgi:hypothetical protein
MMREPLDREVEEDFVIFPATVEGIMAFIETTEPKPSRETMQAHVEDLHARGVLSDDDAELLRRQAY